MSHTPRSIPPAKPTTTEPKPGVVNTQAPAHEGATAPEGFEAEHVVFEIIRIRAPIGGRVLAATMSVEEAEELYRQLRTVLLAAGRRPPLP